MQSNKPFQPEELTVMHSNAGYYVGREIFDPEFGCFVPYSRESVYYRTREQAEDAHAEIMWEIKNLYADRCVDPTLSIDDLPF